MSRTNKPMREHWSKFHGHRYVRRPKVSIQALELIITLNLGKLPKHSIRNGKHCPCCLHGDWGVNLKQRTNRAIRRKVKTTILTQENDA